VVLEKRDKKGVRGRGVDGDGAEKERKVRRKRRRGE
jgi:hypothetical protein